MLQSKLLIALALIVLVLSILYLLGRKSVHHEIIIQVSPEQVWTVLLDTDSYDAWNPVMKVLEGKVAEGNKVKYRFTQDAENSSEIPSKVKKIIPNQLLNQGGGMPIVLTFDHQYRLEPVEEGTRLIIHEDYRGIWVNFWNPAPVQAAYEKLCEATKIRAESL
ncbi:MAG: SRPBCC domain-containing protein [Saprospiraceae bacterium]|nr:SRPBCC domain-containing protein [Saprospiraceae bacterium]